MSAVLDHVAGQEAAVAFLRRAAERPHHAYVLAGPEGSGKSLVARAFVAALLCPNGGCGVCRDCTLALREHHPNEFVVEPEGRDIHIDTIREEVWHHAYRTAPEPGRKVFVIREADRHGVHVRESELIGLLPAAALRNTSAAHLKLTGFSPRQVLENRLRELTGVDGVTSASDGALIDPHDT